MNLPEKYRKDKKSIFIKTYEKHEIKLLINLCIWRIERNQDPTYFHYYEYGDLKKEHINGVWRDRPLIRYSMIDYHKGFCR